MKVLLRLILSILIIVCFSGCSKNTSESSLTKFNFPVSIEKINKNATGNILKSTQLEEDLNYRRTDRDKPLYVEIINSTEVEIFEEPGNTSIDNSKGRYKTIWLAEVGDKKIVNDDDWYFLRIIYPISRKKEQELKKISGIDKKLLYMPPTNGWVKSGNNIIVNPTWGPVYKLDDKKSLPQFFAGNWRFAYTEMEGNKYWSYFIDVDSITERDHKIYFNTMLMTEVMNFIWVSTQKKYKLEILDDSASYYATKYCFDPEKNLIYEAEKIYYNKKGLIESKVNYENEWKENDLKLLKDKNHQNELKKLEKAGIQVKSLDPFDRGKYLVRNAENYLVYELSKNEPMFDKTPNLLYTAFFGVLEGR